MQKIGKILFGMLGILILVALCSGVVSALNVTQNYEFDTDFLNGDNYNNDTDTYVSYADPNSNFYTLINVQADKNAERKTKT